MANKGPSSYIVSDLNIKGGESNKDVGQRLTVESGHIRFDQVSAPSTAPTATAVGSGGSIGAGDGYKYKVTFVTASGETELCTATSNTVTVVNNGSVNLSNIPVSSNVNVIGRKIYRNKIASPNDFFLVDTINNNTTTTYADIKSDAQIGITRYTFCSNTTCGNSYINSTLVSRITPSETAIGYSSLPVGAGFGNAAFGNRALMQNTSGYYNSAVGENALSTGNGIANTAIGAWCLLGGVGGVSGISNAAIGFGALQNITTGSYNNGIGASAGQALTTGLGNVIIGYNAANITNNQAVTDDYCGYIGYQAGRSVVSGIKLNNAWAIGKNAKVGTDNTLVVGGSGSDAMDMVVSGRYFYLGDPNADGCWRFGNTVAGNLVFEKRIVGVWTQKGVFNG